MHDSIALAAADYSSLVILTVGLLAASLFILQSLYLVSFLICITRKRPQDERQ